MAGTKSNVIEIHLLNREREQFHIVGTTPMLMQRLSEKAKRDLLMPPARMNKAERAQRLKHDPELEFRNSVHTLRDPNAPTLLCMPATAFKSAMRGAALDLPGASKAEVGRLVYVNHEFVPVWGLPKLHMAGVRMADPKRTPDIRTRAILPKWAAVIDVSWVAPNLRTAVIANLLANAGFTQGIGDGRPEKGAMSYGQFRVCSADDSEFLSIVESGGRAAQQAMIDTPIPYNDETADLLDWFANEMKARSRESELSLVKGKKAKAKSAEAVA